MLAFILGLVVGAAAVLFVLFVYVVDPWGPISPPPPFIDQFKPIQIPEELRQFLKSGEDGQGISKWESCHSLSLFLHMFYQEHKDTRQLRRWIHKRLQMELNDIATRSAAGRLLQEIRIRDLSLGNKFPSVVAMRVEDVEMSEDKNVFEKIIFVVDIDYTGGFETSIDVTTMFGKKASLSIKITKLSGLVRIVLSRQPYNHWAMSFVSAPVFETDISSEIQGHQLKRLIPLIKESIKRALQRKHVWPNYKIRYRPIFPNPIFQASPPLSAFAHIKLEGGLEVTVLQCTRLHSDILDNAVSWEVYCTVTIDKRPFLQNTSRNVAHSLSVMLVFSRYDLEAPIGIIYDKVSSTSSNSVGPRPVRVAQVEPGSLACKAMFQAGDTLVAINNVPIRSERQATRFLQQTTGDLMVLVDRNLDEIDENYIKESEQLIGDATDDPDDAFVALGCVKRPIPSFDSHDNNTESGSHSNESQLDRRHSISLVPSLPSVTSLMDTESINSSIGSIDGRIGRDSGPTAGGFSVQRTESARVPHVLVSQPSMDLRRTRSESQIDVKSLDLSSLSNTPRPEITPGVSVESLKDVLLNMSNNQHATETTTAVLDQDRTLTSGGSASADGIISKGSTASLVSSVSTKTDITDDGEQDEETEELRLSRNRATSTRRRLQATIQAGKRKVLDFIPAKKRNAPLLNDPIEVGSDANDLESTEPDRERDSRSPLPQHGGKRSPIEMQVVDKKEKKKLKLKRSPRCASSKSGSSFSPDSPGTAASIPESARSRCTKAIHFSENVLWGQSLHFDLSGSTSPGDARSAPVYKYLNVTIHAKESTSTPSREASDPKRPVLLGYTSLYIPQLLDDCKLTLSNCHREVFPLKPPAGVAQMSESGGITGSSEFSRHAGFDQRLCYGDVTLGFRYFPGGLPLGAGTNATPLTGDESDAEVVTDVDSLNGLPISSSAGPVVHEWIPWSAKAAGSTTCAMCRGKIWLKSASCCQRCLVICHSKCVSKAAAGIVCTPSKYATDTDTNFEELDVDLNTAMLEAEDDLPVIHTTPQKAGLLGDSDSLSRRTRLKNKVTEKFSYWRRGRKKEDNDVDSISCHSSSTVDTETVTHQDSNPPSPVASIHECIADVLSTLEGSPFINDLYFHPGNAYNEETIKNAKLLGKDIFSNLQGEERRDKINEQIDIIQKCIRETKDGRLAAMKNETDHSHFTGLDERLQALAVVMLHYCAALQDCSSLGRVSPTDSMKDEACVGNIVDPSPVNDSILDAPPDTGSSVCGSHTP